MRGSPSVSRPSGPTSTTSIPSSSAARRAPATISLGALSPPWRRRRWGASAAATEKRPLRRGLEGQTSTATRFLYQPHVGQTTWGTLAEPQRGHSERAGSDSRHAPARRLRAFDFDRFFLGTAIVGKPLVGTGPSPCRGRLGRLSEAGRSYRAIGQLSDPPPSGRDTWATAPAVRGRPRAARGAARGRPTADPPGPAGTRTGGVAVGAGLRAIPASPPARGAGGAPSRPAPAPSRRSSCSPSKVKASSLVGWTW